MSAPTFTLPAGVVCNGRQDFGAGRVLICFTDLKTRRDFSVEESYATTEIIAGAHRRILRPQLSASPGFLPSRSQVAAACFAPVLMLLCCTADATPTRWQPKTLPLANCPKASFSGEMQVIGPRLIDDGKRMESIIVMPDGTRKRFIFEVSPR